MSSEHSDDPRLPAFVDNLDHLGCDISQWPLAAAETAQRLIAESPEAREALSAAQILASSLDSLPQHSAPEGTLARIARRPAPDSWEKLSNWFTGALWRPLLAGTMPLVAGFILGFTLAPNTGDTMADQISLVTLSTSIDTVSSEDFDYGF